MKTKITFAALLIAVAAIAGPASAQGGMLNTNPNGRVDTQHLIGGAVNGTKLSDGLLYHTQVYCPTDAQPSLSAPNGYADPTGVAGDTNRAVFPWCSTSAQYHVKGTQTLLGPLLDTAGKGLDISQDQTDNDGIEYVFGSIYSNGQFVHTVSASTNACFRVTARIADVSGTDDFDIGWRKSEAFQANVDDYDEAAWVNVNLGQLQTETILNNAATVTTSVTGSTWLDDATHTVEVCIKGRKAHYYYDNVEVQKTVAYNFDTSEVIEPFLFFLQATTSPGKIWLTKFEIYDGAEASPTGTN